MRSRSFMLFLASSLNVLILSRAQIIRIVVVEPKHGMPVANECLNVSLGSWDKTDLFVATDAKGVATLTLEGREATAVPVPGKACNGMSKATPVMKQQTIDRISVLPHWHISCQYSNKAIKDPLGKQQSLRSASQVSPSQT